MLGSRKTMCSNDAVRALVSLPRINERCLELQEKKSKTNPGCPLLVDKQLRLLRDTLLVHCSSAISL
jgi:hypothetical protein